MNSTLVQRIRECPTLPSLPAVAIQVLDLAQKEQADIAEIARVISKDPALSSRILRTVNSSFYGRSQSVGTITQALVILGLQSVKTLVLGFSLVSNLAKNSNKGGFKHLTYWRRSIYAATAARTIAAKRGLVQQEECFLIALLMDIGMLVLNQVVGEPYGEINEKAKDHVELAALEQAALGMTHAEAAGILAEQWKLPPLLATSIACHHTPEEVLDPALRKLAELTSLAGRCADVFVNDNAAAAIADVRRFCGEKYGMKDADCDAMLDTICNSTKEVAPLFEIHIASATSYEGVLKRANEALVQITLQSQQQATQLKQQNQQLKTQATTDPLTGLANRGQFDAFLAQHFAIANQSRRPLALLMIDVDKFKLVNDRYGHQAGDQVLRVLGQLLRGVVRAHDLSARYGGEEMALVLPGADRAAATAIAERTRRAVAATPIKCGNGTTIPVTISIGVAVLEPGHIFREPAHLLKAADLAVYVAKRSGRNCVRIFNPRPAHAA